ncbi:MAG: hypothetical protein Q7S16_00830 [bacterium]|nr:hypothetical protein [bacterium]
MPITIVQCPVCCVYFARDYDLVLNPATNKLECQSNNALFISGGGVDCGFHVPAETSVEEIRGHLYEERIAELQAMGIPKRPMEET